MKIQVFIISAFFAVSCNQLSDYKGLFQLAKNKTDNKEYSRAITLLDEIIKYRPDFDSAYVERAYNYLHIGKPNEALNDVNIAIQMNFKNISAYFLRGLIYGSLCEYERAIKDYSHIIRFGDSTFLLSALKERANLYYQTQEIDKSIIDLSKIIAVDSLNYEAYVSRGIARLSNNVYEKYMDSIKIALKDSMYYSNFFKYFNLSYSINDNKGIMFDTKGAIRDFSLSIRIKPANSIGYYNRAKVYESLGLNNKALEDINQAISLSESSDYYMTRALLYKSLKESEKSLNDFNKSIELNPQNGFAYINRGYLKKEQLKDIRGAEKDFKMAERLGVKNE